MKNYFLSGILMSGLMMISTPGSAFFLDRFEEGVLTSSNNCQEAPADCAEAIRNVDRDLFNNWQTISDEQVQEIKNSICQVCPCDANTVGISVSAGQNGQATNVGLRPQYLGVSLNPEPTGACIMNTFPGQRCLPNTTRSSCESPGKKYNICAESMDIIRGPHQITFAPGATCDDLILNNQIKRKGKEIIDRIQDFFEGISRN